MPTRNEDVYCDTNQGIVSTPDAKLVSGNSRRAWHAEEVRQARHKRTRTGSDSAERHEDDVQSTTCRRGRRHTASNAMMSSQAVLSPQSPGDGQRPILDRIDSLEEENSLASSVFVEHPLCPSSKDALLSQPCIVDKASATEPVVCVVTVSKSVEDAETCDTTGLLIEEENISTPNTVQENEDAGSTEGEGCEEEEVEPCREPATHIDRSSQQRRRRSSASPMATITPSNQPRPGESNSSSTSTSPPPTKRASMEIEADKQPPTVSPNSLNRLKKRSRRSQPVWTKQMRRKSFPVSVAGKEAASPTVTSVGAQGSTSINESAASSSVVTPSNSSTSTTTAPPSEVDASLNASFDVTASTGASTPRFYPLRSRIRKESLLRQFQARQTSPKLFDQLPTEVLLRIMHYLNVQDLFRAQRVCKRLHAVVDKYLLLVKRINFSSGLPFAFLPEALDDAALKRILSRTPEVTHILGFYPRHISTGQFLPAGSDGGLTMQGIIDAFSRCSKLRSVELMDVQLMAQLVHYLPRVKFHGMFRNRPDSWDNEYAVPMPAEVRPSASTTANHFANQSPGCVASGSLFGCWLSTLFGTGQPYRQTQSFSALTTQLATSFAHSAALKSNRLASWFEPVAETPLSHGSAAAPQQPGLSRFPLAADQAGLLAAAAAPGPPQVAHPPDWPQQQLPAGHNHQAEQIPAVIALALAAAVNWAAFDDPQVFLRRPGLVALVNNGARRDDQAQQPQPNQQQGAASARVGQGQAGSQQHHQHRAMVSPIPSLQRDRRISLPNAISNLTKLDLVSVAISNIPRLDNIKYLHLKWVNFTDFDPFVQFSTPKLQSFVMNNCVGPQRVVRYVRIFAALSRATQLSRLELVGCRFVDGLIEHLLDNGHSSVRSFRNIQRLVLAGNKDIREMDIGFLLIAAQNSLGHVALQTWHTRNSLFDALQFANVKLAKLESLVLGYQDPFQSRLTTSELLSMELVDSADNLWPMCNITDRGMHTCLHLCPRLTCLTVRHAPFLESLLDWCDMEESPADQEDEDMDDPVCGAPASPWPEFEEEAPMPSSSTASASLNQANKQQSQQQHQQQQQSASGPSSSIFATNGVTGTNLTANNNANPANSCAVRSLTLENCPGLTTNALEDALHSGRPFPNLDTVVLRNMFLAQPGSQEQLSERASWASRWMSGKTTSGTDERHESYQTVTVLLALADSLSSCGIGLPPLSPAGVGLGSSCREVTVQNMMLNMRQMGRPVDDWNIFLSLRLHTYINAILQLDGGCGSNDQERRIEGRPLISEVLLGRQPLFYPSRSRAPKRGRPSGEAAPQPTAHFVSTGTQTCICGLLEVDAFMKLSHGDIFNEQSSVDDERTAKTTGVRPSRRSFHGATAASATKQHNPNDSSTHPQQQHPNQLEGPLAFHPFSPSNQHMRLFELHSNSAWSRDVVPHLIALYPASEVTVNADLCDAALHRILDLVPRESLPGGESLPRRRPSARRSMHETGMASAAAAAGSSRNSLTTRRFLPRQLATRCLKCVLCASSPRQLIEQRAVRLCPSISETTPEFERQHVPRSWTAWDASVDTTELRCHTGALPQALTLKQPVPGAHLSYITTLHFENVGISHLVLQDAHRLKNVNLENCPELRGIILHRGESVIDPVPALRRVRIIRCPKFAIYHWLHSVTQLYPQHEENLFITYRPFGRYNSSVERALWEHAHSAHVMVSSDYKQHESERNMEEFHSSFDQLFREVMNFSDMLIRRDLIHVHQPYADNTFTRSEHGAEWDLVTDVPWVHEVCCSMLPNGTTDSGRSEQADQLYELLSEVQSANNFQATNGSSAATGGIAAGPSLPLPQAGGEQRSWKVSRRGIHLHVQYRDVHGKSRNERQPDSLFDWFDTPSWYIKYPYTDQYLASCHPGLDLNVWDDGLDCEYARHLPPRPRLGQLEKPTRKMSMQAGVEAWQRLLLTQEETERLIEGEMPPPSGRKRASMLCVGGSGVGGATVQVTCERESADDTLGECAAKRRRHTILPVGATTRSKHAA